MNTPTMETIYRVSLTHKILLPYSAEARSTVSHSMASSLIENLWAYRLRASSKRAEFQETENDQIS